MLTPQDLQAISEIVKTEIKPLDQKLNNVDGRLTNVEIRLTNVESRLSNVENRLDNIEDSLEETRSATNALLDWAERVEDVIGVRI